ncbi:MAG: MnmC family methyltransferase [Bdellovibrionota bacterium]
MSKYVWIKTQDGSPTLWNNDIGEPFRSAKGAFHESLIVFVKPAIEFAQQLILNGKTEINVGEFGLGAGTNWVLFSCLAQHLKIPFKYFAIEQDTESYELARLKWSEEKILIQEKIKEHLGLDAKLNIESLPQPEIFPSLKIFSDEFVKRNKKCDIWFHDPFGSGVNPEGYTEETLQLCSINWGKPCIGLSYACNGAFQQALKSLGLTVNTRLLNSPPLKREALEFKTH